MWHSYGSEIPHEAVRQSIRICRGWRKDRATTPLYKDLVVRWIDEPGVSVAAFCHLDDSTQPHVWWTVNLAQNQRTVSFRILAPQPSAICRLLEGQALLAACEAAYSQPSRRL